MGHGHDHSHAHAHGGSAGKGNRRRLAITLALISTYMVAEFVGGLLTNSLALLADAGHMLSDAGALALSLFAMWLAARPAKARFTYGYYRTEILAALVNGATLVAVSIYIFVEAFARISEPPEVQGLAMMGIATGGLAINLIALWILHGGRGESLNMRGAWLHVLTDALGSVGAMTAGVLVWQFGWRWADPLASVVIGLLVIYSSWRLLLETVGVLMESAPGGLDVDQIRTALLDLDDVNSVHDLHVWTITSGLVSLSAHITAHDNGDGADLLRRARTMLATEFSIEHVTLQIEPEGFEETRLDV